MEYSYEYSYDMPLGTQESAIAGVLSIYLIILLVCTIFYLLSYIFKAIGVYTMAKRQRMDYPWLAFIPFARTYLHGELAGRIGLKNKTIKNPGIWLLAFPFIYGVIGTVFYIIFIGIMGINAFMSFAGYADGNVGSAVSFGVNSIIGMIIWLLLFVLVSILYEAVYKVLAILINHQIFMRFTSKNMSIAHAVLSAVVPLYESICFFVMRDKGYNPGMEPDIPTPPVTPLPPIPPVPPVPPEAKPTAPSTPPTEEKQSVSPGLPEDSAKLDAKEKTEQE